MSMFQENASGSRWTKESQPVIHDVWDELQQRDALGIIETKPAC